MAQQYLDKTGLAYLWRLIQQKIEKAPFNKTKQGIITKNYMDGTYDVRFDGNLYTKILTYPNSTSLQLGQTVKIIIPNNQSSQMYISAEGSPLIYYPVGSIYMSVNSTSPATLFGGTWERIQDRFLLAASPAYRPGGMGGEETHTLTVNEMPSHEHRDMMFGNNSGNYFGVNQGAQVDPGFESKWNVNYTTGTGQAYFYTARAGNSAAHNNMPPYLAVYMWKRTA